MLLNEGYGKKQTCVYTGTDAHAAWAILPYMQYTLGGALRRLKK